MVRIEVIFLIISAVALLLAVIVNMNTSRKLDESIKEYKKIVKEYMDFVNSLK